jgi:hypothetical protein
MKEAHIYRYNDKVAVSIGGVTTYLSRLAALEISEAIFDAMQDLDLQPDFSKSMFSTRTTPTDL